MGDDECANRAEAVVTKWEREAARLGFPAPLQRLAGQLGAELREDLVFWIARELHEATAGKA